MRLRQVLKRLGPLRRHRVRCVQQRATAERLGETGRLPPENGIVLLRLALDSLARLYAAERDRAA